jgi:N-acetyl-anhydromuramyl-L-alanine amidase AmpD
MRLLRTSFVLACAALALGAAAAPAPAREQAVKHPQVSWQPTTSFTPAERKPTQIRYIVVHVTEGSLWGSVEWLQNPEAHASSHYVVGRAGRIVQMVRVKDVAWHAGNRRMNELSIGIEHEGMTNDPAGFTRAQYEASARITAFHARRSLMPITRRHIIGHDEVPHPSDPHKRGGANAHSDPGPYWNWDLYLRLVRRFAADPLRVDSPTISEGQTLRGTVPWTATASGTGLARVEFLVNGAVRWRSTRAPHRFAGGRGLNTTALRNGRHVLEVRAVGRNGASARRRTTVQVRNAPFVLTSAGLRQNERLWRVVELRASVRDAPARSVELLVNGRRAAIATRAPYSFRWDARRAKPGPHVLTLRAVAQDGRVQTQTFRVVVARPAAPARPPAPPAPPRQPPQQPPPPPEVPAPVLVGQVPAEGASVSGTVEWRAQMTGRVARVEYLVDGALRHTATGAPFAFEWDTTKEAPGPRVLTIRLVGPTGKVATGSVTVTVETAPPPDP